MSSILNIRCPKTETFTANGNTVTLAEVPASIKSVKVNEIENTNYTVDENIITFGSTPASGISIVVDYSYFSGIPVLNGKDGVTPHIGPNGNWFLGTNDTGVSATGQGSNIPYTGVVANVELDYTKWTEIDSSDLEGYSVYTYEFSGAFSTNTTLNDSSIVQFTPNELRYNNIIFLKTAWPTTNNGEPAIGATFYAVERPTENVIGSFVCFNIGA